MLLLTLFEFGDLTTKDVSCIIRYDPLYHIKENPLDWVEDVKKPHFI